MGNVSGLFGGHATAFKYTTLYLKYFFKNSHDIDIFYKILVFKTLLAICSHFIFFLSTINLKNKAHQSPKTYDDVCVDDGGCYYITLYCHIHLYLLSFKLIFCFELCLDFLVSVNLSVSRSAKAMLNKTVSHPTQAGGVHSASSTHPGVESKPVQQSQGVVLLVGFHPCFLYVHVMVNSFRTRRRAVIET